MRKILIYLVKLFFFWLILFAVNRIIFFIVEHQFLKGLSFSQIARSFRYAIPLDVSAACYGLMIPLLLMIIAFITSKKIWLHICKYVVLFFIFFHCAVAYGEAALYTQWQSKLSYEALSHFGHPSEVFKSASAGLTILFFALTIAFVIIYFLIYLRWAHIRKLAAGGSFGRRAIIGTISFLILAFIIFTGVRGGWKRFPISVSISFYSTHPVLNDAAANPTWNLFNSLKEYKQAEEKNPYHYMPATAAQKIVQDLFAQSKDTTISILTTTRPNIVFFILESFSADAIDTKPEITPVLDSLINNGIYFDSLYASGHVSDQGIPANLSAFPATSSISICSEPQKTKHLPSIVENLSKAGYHSAFLYGGQLDFGNLRSYVYNKKFDEVQDRQILPDSLPRGALGVPDGVMAGVVANELSRAKAPFFYCWYTLSSHMPYDIPVPYSLHINDTEVKFINSMHYSDSAIGILLQKIRNESWYHNTLFVFVSDHSHDSQITRTMQEKGRHRIPFILYGDVIKKEWRGKRIHRISSQLDIVCTLLKQLQLSSSQYPWSRNLFNPYTKQIANYNFVGGTGLVTPNGYVALENNYKNFLQQSVKDSTQIPLMIQQAKAFQQEAYRYFLKW